MNVILSAQINIFINERLLFQSKLKYCELYHRDYCLMQCFKYQKYKHMIWICCQNQKYDFCMTLKHDNHNCIFWNESNKHCCMNCEKLHSAWFFKCKTRQKQVEKIQLVYLIKLCRYMSIFTVLMKLNKNIWENFFQTCLNQSSIISTVLLNKTVHEKHFQNESENVFQKLMQNKNCEKYSQTLSNQLQNAENNILSVSKFIFIQISMMNFQMLINCS